MNLYILLLLIPTTLAASCQNSAINLFLVLDGYKTDSPDYYPFISDEDFDRALNILASVVDDLPIGPGINETLVSLTIFDVNYAQNKFQIGEHSTKESTKQAILATTRHVQLANDPFNSEYKLPNITLIGLGIETAITDYLEQKLYNDVENKRKNIPNVMVVITFGKNDENLTRYYLDANNELIKVFVIGVGSNVNRNELDAAAGSPSRAISITNLDGMKNALDGICLQIPEPFTCNKADIVFVVDSSDWTTREEYTEQLNALANAVGKLNVSSTGTRIGLVTYDTTAYKRFLLGQYSTKAAVQKAFRRQRFTNRESASVELGIKIATNKVFGQAGDRADVDNVMIVVSTGRTDNEDSLVKQQQDAALRGIRVYSIGVDFELEESELAKISGSFERIFQVYVDELEDTIGKICA